jgi:NDP-sugar pyrophosphorylase family protein
MKILLHATGESTKLAPLTDHITSPMLPILNRPVMAYNLELLIRHKFKHISASLHKNPSEIEAYFGDGQYRGANITYLLQKNLLGDAGSIRWVYPQADEPVVLLPADRLIDLQLDRLIDFHETKSAGISVVLGQTTAHVPTSFFYIKDEKIVSIGNGKKLSDRWILTGVYIFSPEIIQKIPYRKPYTVVDDLLPALLKEGYPIHAYQFEGYWNPLETFLDYWEAQSTVMSFGLTSDHSENTKSELNYLGIEGKQQADGIWIGHNNWIHPSVLISPQLYFHKNNRIEKDVQIGPDVVISQNVIVDRGATIQNSLILDHTYVGQLVNIHSKIVYKNLVIDLESGEYVRLSDEFLLGEARSEYLDLSFRLMLGWLLALGLFVLLLPLFLLAFGLLVLDGKPIFEYTTCVNNEFRWFIPAEERKFRSIDLIRFRTHHSDQTITRLGRFLKATQINRLPELINVIRGDLTLVGVKPLSIEISTKLTEDWEKTRFSVPAGITGLWFLRTNENSTLDEVLITDSYYAVTRTWKEDLMILLRTPLAWTNHLRGLLRFPVEQKEAKQWK